MKNILLVIGVFLSSIVFSQPDWRVVNYTSSTTIYGIVTISKVPAKNGDKVGAFVGSECRAVGDVILNGGNAYVTLQIQGEKIETVTFKIWNTLDNKIFDCEKGMQSFPSSSLGLPPNYIEINGSFVQPVINFRIEEDVTIFPNPFTSIIYIESLKAIDKIIIYNQLGQKVYEAYNQFEFINTENFPNGIYLVMLTDKNNNLYVKKLIK